MEASLCPLPMNYVSTECFDDELQNDGLEQYFWEQYTEDYRTFINEYLNDTF